MEISGNFDSCIGGMGSRPARVLCGGGQSGHFWPSTAELARRGAFNQIGVIPFCLAGCLAGAGKYFGRGKAVLLSQSETIAWF
jgi:hypothetical protein